MYTCINYELTSVTYYAIWSRNHITDYGDREMYTNSRKKDEKERGRGNACLP